MRVDGRQRQMSRIDGTVGYAADEAMIATRSLIENPENRPTAILAATFLTAAGAMRTLHEFGIDIPGKMSVIGIHDAEIASILFPPLTTVRMPNREMGRRAATLLVDLLEDREADGKIMLEPEKLVLRASTAMCWQR